MSASRSADRSGERSSGARGTGPEDPLLGRPHVAHARVFEERRGAEMNGAPTVNGTNGVIPAQGKSKAKAKPAKKAGSRS